MHFKDSFFVAYTLNYYKGISKFNDIVVTKCKFNFFKSPICIGDVDIDDILVSNEVSFGKMS